MTATTQQSASSSSNGLRTNDSQALHMRQGSRQRKQSLSDLIPVERIGSVDRQETFKDVTTSLNKEVSRQSSGA
jgi:glycerol-3-phosphate O-acyltransferase/dihydroxyacetone phosphate acyltransferase